MQNNRPIFIVGAARSGTTLLQYMLRSHPRISLPTGESQFIIPLQRTAETFGDLCYLSNIRGVLKKMYHMNPEFLDANLHGMRFDIDTLAAELYTKGCDTIPKIIEGLFAKNARGEGKPRWGDKTPYYVFHMQTLLDMFPTSQFIHIIRDGRDCALSMFSRKHDFGVYNTYFAAKFWRHFVDAGQQTGLQLPSDTYMEFRYEDLLSDPRGVVKKICTFLGEPYSECVVNFNRSTEAGKTPLLQKPLQRNNFEKWRRLMTPIQIRMFESAAGETLRRNGYPLATEAKPFPLPVRAAFRIHNDLMKRCNRKFQKRRP